VNKKSTANTVLIKLWAVLVIVSVLRSTRFFGGG